MPSSVDVDITDGAIITALNTPGGEVAKWRDRVAKVIVAQAELKSPVNDPLNAAHRGGVVGTYKASWGWDKSGSGGHSVQANIKNSSDHADIVEYGRPQTTGRERFSWAKHRPPGSIKTHKGGTRGRDGQHVLRNAVNVTMPRYVDDYTPLV